MVAAEHPPPTLRVAEAAEAWGLSPHTLRSYERAGLLEPVSRNRIGHRRYNAVDLERISFLTKLRGAGMPVRDVRRYAALMRAGEVTNEQRLALLEAHRETVVAKLEATGNHLELIDLKINFYRERLKRT
jgi:DNA-binding transcriptional MerR regulator